MELGVFSDESKHNAVQFRSIAAISLPADMVVDTNKRIAKILAESNVKEFKWNQLRGARERLCAIKLIDFTLDNLIAQSGRVDVLIWDTHDSRHRIMGRDDTKNFERMFFHLHNQLMSRREPDAFWHLRPDERVDVDWDTIKDCLRAVGLREMVYEHPLLRDSYSHRFFNIKSFKQVESHEAPLCQLADLFAGIAPYTRERCELMKSLIRTTSGQHSLFSVESLKPSKRDNERFSVITHLCQRGSAKKLGISFRSNGYFKTHNPKNPINFWHYIPQNVNDRAPTRDY